MSAGIVQDWQIWEQHVETIVQPQDDDISNF